MSLFYDLFRKGVDYYNLPEDCPACAAERMEREYLESGSVSPIDRRIVLGDVNGFVDAFSDEKLMVEQFLRRVDAR